MADSLPTTQTTPGLPLPQVGVGLPPSPAMNDPLFGLNPVTGFGLGTPGMSLSESIAQYPTSYLGQVMLRRQMEMLQAAGLPLDSDPNAWTPDEAAAQTDTAIAKIATVNPDLARQLQEERTGQESGKGFWESLKSAAGSLLHPFVVVGAKALDIISRPSHIIPELFVDKGDDPWYEDIAQALSGESRTTWADALEQWGVENPVVRGIAGFAGDVLTDPITYVTFGLGGVGRKVVAATAARLAIKEAGAISLIERGLISSADDAAARASSLMDDFLQRSIHRIGHQMDPEVAAGLAKAGFETAERQVWGDMYEVGDLVTRMVNMGLPLERMPATFVTTSGKTFTREQIVGWVKAAKTGTSFDRDTWGMAKSLAGALGGMRFRAAIPFTNLRFVTSPLPFMKTTNYQFMRRFFAGQAGLPRLVKAVDSGMPGVGWDDVVRWMDNGPTYAIQANPALRAIGGRGMNLGSNLYSLSEQVGRVTAHMSPHARALRTGYVGILAADASRAAREVEDEVLRTAFEWTDPTTGKVMSPEQNIRELTQALHGATDDPDIIRFYEVFPDRAAFENPELFVAQTELAEAKAALDEGLITADEFGEFTQVTQTKLDKMLALKRKFETLDARAPEALFRYRDSLTHLADEAGRREVAAALYWDVNYDGAAVLNEGDAVRWASRSHPATRDMEFYASAKRATDPERRVQQGFTTQDLRPVGEERGYGIDLSTARPGVLRVTTGTGQVNREAFEALPQADPDFLYHATGASNLESITSGGLRGARQGGATAATKGLEGTEVVYLADTPQDAFSLAEIAEREQVLLRTRVRGAANTLQREERTVTAVAPEDLEMWTGSHWAPIAEPEFTKVKVRVRKPLVVDETAEATLSDQGRLQQYYSETNAAVESMKASKVQFGDNLSQHWKQHAGWTADEGVTEMLKQEGYDSIMYRRADGSIQLTVFDPKNAKVIDEWAPDAIADRGWFPRVPSDRVDEALRGLQDESLEARYYGAPRLRHDMRRGLRYDSQEEAASEWRERLAERGIELGDDVPMYETDILKIGQKYAQRYAREFSKEEIRRTFSRIQTLGEVAPKMLGGAIGFSRYRWKVLSEGDEQWRILDKLEKDVQAIAVKHAKLRSEYLEEMHRGTIRSSKAWAHTLARLDEVGGDLRRLKPEHLEGMPVPTKVLDPEKARTEIRLTLQEIARLGKGKATAETKRAIEGLEMRLIDLRQMAAGVKGPLASLEAFKKAEGIVDVPVGWLRRNIGKAENQLRAAPSAAKAPEYPALKKSIKQGFDRSKPATLYVGKDGKIELIDGTHRLLAATELGLETIPVQMTGALDWASLYAWATKTLPKQPPAGAFMETLSEMIGEAAEAAKHGRFPRALKGLTAEGARESQRYVTQLKRQSDAAYKELERAYTKLTTEMADVKPALVPVERAMTGFVSLGDKLGIKEMRGLAAPAYIAEEFQWAMRQAGDIGEARRLWRRWVMGPWKEWATFRFPGFHVRNNMGAWFNNWLGGVNEQDYFVATSILKAKGDFGSGLAKTWAEKTVPEEVVERYGLRSVFGKERLTWGHLADLTNDVGIHRANSIQVAGVFDVTADLDRLMRVHGVGGVLRRTGRQWDRAMRWMGGSTEDFHRTAAFLGGMRQTGGDVYGSRAFTMMRHGDYEDLNGFEEFIKDLVPFYKWFRTNTPYQLHQLFEAPALPLAVIKGKEAAYEVMGYDYDEELKKQPGWMRYVFNLPLPKSLSSDQALHLITLDLPFADAFNGMNEYISMFLPMVRPFIESYGIQKNVFTGEEYSGKMVPLGTLNPLNVPLVRDGLVQLGVLKRGTEGQYLIDDKLQNVMSGWPVYGRFRNWLYAEESRAQLRANTIASSIFGFGLRSLGPEQLTKAELEYYNTEIEPVIESMRDMGVVFPDKDDIDPNVWAAIGLELPEEAK